MLFICNKTVILLLKIYAILKIQTRKVGTNNDYEINRKQYVFMNKPKISPFGLILYKMVTCILMMVNQDKKGGNRMKKMKNSTFVYLTLKEIRELRKVIIHYDLEKGETLMRDCIYNKLFDADERIERMRVRAETEKGLKHDN